MAFPNTFANATTATGAQLDANFNALSANNGSSNVGFIQSGTGAVSRNVQIKLLEYVSVKDFGAVGDGVTDDTAAIQAAASYCASLTNPSILKWPAGIYLYSVSPNWATCGSNFRMIADGVVRLRYTGTGDAFFVDTLAGNAVYNQYFGRFIIEAPTTARHGVRVRNSNHSVFDFDVRGCGSTAAALWIDFAVCSRFPNFTVSNNEQGGGVQGWYLNAKPLYGVYFSSINGTAINPSSFCFFDNPIIEGVGTGVTGNYGLGHMFIGGTIEGCTTDGANIPSTATRFVFKGVDFEVNSVHDILDNGFNNIWEDCDTSNLVTFAATSKYCSLIRGNHSGQITFVSGATNNLCEGVNYNTLNNGTLISDSGNATRMRDNRNNGLGIVHNVYPNVTSLVVGASPWTYTNTTANDVRLAIGGGTVSSIVYGRAIGGSINIGTTGQATLSPGDLVTITYTVAPTALLVTY